MDRTARRALAGGRRKFSTECSPIRGGERASPSLPRMGGLASGRRIMTPGRVLCTLPGAPEGETFLKGSGGKKGGVP